MTGAKNAVLTIIPARMAASRLPNKPLKELAGKPMITHVWHRAMEAGLGPVLVATDSEEIKEVIVKEGGDAVLTVPDHPSGSDRIFEALNLYDRERKYSKVINLQGDLPTLEPSLVKTCAALLEDEAVDISTLAAEIRDAQEKTNPNVVKLVGSPVSETRQRALYFTRSTCPFGDGPLYHHIGIYGYKRKTLEQFIKTPPSPLEKREKLEQLRALEAGMRIDVAIVNTVPLGVDTKEDLEKARKLLDNKQKNESTP